MPNQEVINIMNADESGKQMVEFANKKGEELSRDLKRAQIRSIFAEARKVQAQWGVGSDASMRKLNMLKPKLFYQAKRNPSVDPLRAILADAIDEVAKESDQKKRSEKFERFMDLFEAILAYHRYHGGN
ncbi:MAG: type III-A CRISPR-associated protein Csm2 [Chloroflexi bacterium]|nr:type III-A CRISPR-associated protein Csm2 [Chloroflexota bacterium]